MPPQQTQQVLRQLFTQWGLPDRLRVDNGTPWGSWSDLPPDLALWLIGLGVELLWNTPGRPQENGVVERSHGTGQRWAEPRTCGSPAQLQRRIDAMDRIQRAAYPVPGGPNRCAAYPELTQPRRRYTRRGEQRHWDMHRVLEHLSGYAVTRRVASSGHVRLYNRSYYVGVVHRGIHVYVMFDPERREWLFTDEHGRQLTRHPAPEITRTNVLQLHVSHRPAVSWRQRRKAP